jgi:hypothetical protein
MVSALRFGRRQKVPYTVEIKHQLLTLWLKDQIQKEAAAGEAAASNGGLSSTASGGRDAPR